MQLEEQFVFPEAMHPLCCHGVAAVSHGKRGLFSMPGRQKCSAEMMITLEQIFPTYLGVQDRKKGEGSSQSLQVGQTQSIAGHFPPLSLQLTECPLRSGTLYFQAPQHVCREYEVSYHTLLSHKMPLELPARPRVNSGQTQAMGRKATPAAGRTRETPRE